MNCFSIADQGAWRLCGSAGCTSVVATCKALLESCDEDVISSGELEPGCKSEGKFSSIGDVLGSHDELNEICLLDINGEHLAILVDANHAIGGHVTDRAEHKLVGNPLTVNKGTLGCLVHEEVTHLCYHKDHSVFWRNLHQHWEISGRVSSHLNIGSNFEFLRSRGGIANFHDVQSDLSLSSLLLAESKEVVSIARGRVGDWDVSETSRIAFK